jgi:hypothetical protein
LARLDVPIHPGQSQFHQAGGHAYALDILCSHLEVTVFDVEVLDLTFRETDWPLVEYFAVHDPILVG